MFSIFLIFYFYRCCRTLICFSKAILRSGQYTGKRSSRVNVIRARWRNLSTYFSIIQLIHVRHWNITCTLCIMTTDMNKIMTLFTFLDEGRSPSWEHSSLFVTSRHVTRTRKVNLLDITEVLSLCNRAYKQRVVCGGVGE